MKPTAYNLQPAFVHGPRSTAYGQLQPTAIGLRTLVCRLRPASAFTLVELLVVIVIIAILLGITLPVSKYAIARAKQARQEVMLAKIRGALDDYRAAYGEYPITPDTNHAAGAPPSNYSDAIRHYPDNYTTDYTSNSIYTNAWLTSAPLPNGPGTGTGTGTVEYVKTQPVDYCLTYPLELRQVDKGARPFYVFPEVTVISIVYKHFAGDAFTQNVRRRGGVVETLSGLVGQPINRLKAIDPVSMRQWKYTCYDGVSYTITTNSFQ